MLKYLKTFALTCNGNFPPLVSFMGGFVSQEIIKAITQKFMPLKQMFYADCVEVIADLPKDDSTWSEFLKTNESTNISNIKTDRNTGLISVIG